MWQVPTSSNIRAPPGERYRDTTESIQTYERLTLRAPTVSPTAPPQRAWPPTEHRTPLPLPPAATARPSPF